MGFIQLIDLLVGLEPEPVSLARLMWGIRYVDEASADFGLRTYFADRALRHYDTAKAMALPEVLDKIVEEASAAVVQERIQLSRDDDQARVAKFLDRFEDRFFEYLDEAIQEERDRSKPS